MSRAEIPDVRVLGGGRPELLQALKNSSDVVAHKCTGIHNQVIAGTRGGATDVRGLDETVLKYLFGLYDQEFFEGLLTRMLKEDGAGDVAFRISGRLTRAAGKTIKTVRRSRPGTAETRRVSYEIAISILLLRASFGEGTGRSVTVGGLVCKDWVEALQRVFEHELLHLAEFLGWGTSSCAGANFQSLSWKIFGHEASHHDLVTPREQAAQVHGVRIGDLVSFEFDGVRRAGRVNRITKRATILVEDPAGRPFTDGKLYTAFYVPLFMLRKECGLS